MTKDTDPPAYVSLPDLAGKPLPSSYEAYKHPLAGFAPDEGWFESELLTLKTVAVSRGEIPSPMNSQWRLAFCQDDNTPLFSLATDGFLTYGVLASGKSVAVAHIIVATQLDLTKLPAEYFLHVMSTYFLQGLDCGGVESFHATQESEWTKEADIWAVSIAVAAAVPREVVESALLLDLARADHAKAQLEQHFPEKDAKFDPASALLRFSTDNMEPN